jgi:hypothetical protein
VPPLKEFKEKMKKIYFSPECEVIKIDPVVLTSASPDPDTTDPVPVINEPDEDDLNW